MKRLNSTVTALTLGAVLYAALIPAAYAATPVKNVMMAKSGDFTEVTIPVPSHLLCEHFTEPATAERPFRIVLNLCNAEHSMPQQNFSALPACMVQKIRTSQFAKTPDPTVRVVLDLKSSATYTVRTESDRLVVAIADPSPAFAAWEACPPVMAKTQKSMESERSAQADKTREPAPNAPTTVAKNVTPATREGEATAEPALKTEPTVMAQAPKLEPAVKKTEKPKINPPSAAAYEPSAAKPSQSLVLESVAPKQESPKTAAPTVAMTSDELVGPHAKPEPPVTVMEPVTPVVVAPAIEDFKLPSQPLVLAPEILDAANVGNMDLSVTTPETQLSAMPAFSGNTPQVTTSGTDAPMLAAVTNPANEVTLPPTVSSSDTLTGQEALIDRLKAKFFSGARAPKPYLTEEGIMAEQWKGGDSLYGPPTPGSDMDREALLARIRQAALQNEQNIPANMLPSVPGGPARSELFYEDLGRRDPFEPLLKGQRSGFISDALPSVESLRMVGMLKDDDQAMALMEDTDGHSYIMRPGDAVENGRVLSVGEARTVIQVDEYGWTRTVVLQLSPRGGDPSKALGLRPLMPEGEDAVEPQPGE